MFSRAIEKETQSILFDETPCPDSQLPIVFRAGPAITTTKHQDKRSDPQEFHASLRAVKAVGVGIDPPPLSSLLFFKRENEEKPARRNEII